jgi:hypothetical protein
MIRWWSLLAAFLAVCFAVGCGDNTEKGKYRDKDKPQAVDKP